MSDYLEKYNEWLNNPYFDEEDRKSLELIKGNNTEIEDRFYKDLEFGTGGLRDVLGLGTNRINKYTIRKATQGLANYIKTKTGASKGVVIAYDSRRDSAKLADESAVCLNANGIKTYIFPELTSTPELSFSVRQLGAIAGIVITASHNPPEYNGYKVYWEDGSQIVPSIAEEIIEEINKIKSFDEVKTMTRMQAKADGLYKIIGSDMDDKYISAVKKMSLDEGEIKQVADDFKICYTPLNGTGNIPVRRLLKEAGFKNVFVVKEQEEPDPEFTTLKSPNPEDPGAYKLALELAKEKNADIVLATDPDADRLGVYARDSVTGEYVSFSGNMSAMLIAEYLLSKRRERGTLHEPDSQITEKSGLKGVLVTTIVSTNMAKAIAREYNLKLIEVLTGFKFIGEQIKLFEQRKNYYYEFGFEESYGCLVGTHARDKDAPMAALMLCEAAAYYRTKGLTLVDQMNNIFKKYGYYQESQSSEVMKGAKGSEKISEIMEKLRKDPPCKFGKWNVLEIRDYKNNSVTDTVTGKKFLTGLPTSNVLYFELDNDAWCCVRPSGTEPKIKFYTGVKSDSLEHAKEDLVELKKAVYKEIGLDNFNK